MTEIANVVPITVISRLIGFQDSNSINSESSFRLDGDVGCDAVAR